MHPIQGPWIYVCPVCFSIPWPDPPRVCLPCPSIFLCLWDLGFLKGSFANEDRGEEGIQYSASSMLYVIRYPAYRVEMLNVVSKTGMVFSEYGD